MWKHIEPQRITKMPRKTIRSSNSYRLRSGMLSNEMYHFPKFTDAISINDDLYEETKFERLTKQIKTAGIRFLLPSLNGVLYFPCGIRLGVGRCGAPDLRLNLFRFEAGNEVTSPFPHNTSNLMNPTNALIFLSRFGGLLMANTLFPRVIDVLSKIIGIASVVSSFLGPKLHLPQMLLGFIGRLFGFRRNNNIQSALNVNVAQAEQLPLLKNILIQFFSPTLAICVLDKMWKFIHPESRRLADASNALLVTKREYNKVSKKVRLGKIKTTYEIEEAWLNAHKRAARKIAHLLGELPDAPPLKGFLDRWESMTLELGNQSCSSYYLSDMTALSFILNVQKSSKITNEVINNNAENRNQRSMSARQVINCRPSTSSQGGMEGAGEEIEVERDRRAGIPARAHWFYGTLIRTRKNVNKAKKRTITIDSKSLTSSSKPIDIEDNSEPIDTEPINDNNNLNLSNLYGRNDHAVEEKENFSLKENLTLTKRSIQLFIIFFKVFIIAIILLVLAKILDIPIPTKKSKKEESAKLKKKAYNQVLQGCRKGGCAFIKWGQWSSTREDLFPAEFCNALSELHDQAPYHSFQETKNEIYKSFNKVIDDLFIEFDPNPIASGSVAQVYRAKLLKDGELVPVVVKVRHPNVGTQISTDFKLFKKFAEAASQIPSLKNFPIKESVSQFSHTMTAQTDMRIEAAHIERFEKNFEKQWRSIGIPKIHSELLSESVLVESFEEGKSVQHYIKNPTDVNTSIVTLGVDTYLKMLLSDNFVHTDLHPGNILVQEFLKDNGEKDVRIVLLDFGLVEEVKPKVRKYFISFLNMISKGDGEMAACYMLHWSDDQRCPDPDAFTRDVIEFFNEHCNIHSDTGIDVDRVIKSMLRLARKHNVSIDSSYASLVLGICILVGFATNLDPRVNLMDAATPVFLTYMLTGRVVGRMYG